MHVHINIFTYESAPGAYVSIRQNTSGYVRIRPHTRGYQEAHSSCSTQRATEAAPGAAVVSSRPPGCGQTIHCVRARWFCGPAPHTSAYVSIRQHTSGYVSAYVSQHTSASIRQHTSAYVSMGVVRTCHVPRGHMSQASRAGTLVYDPAAHSCNTALRQYLCLCTSSCISICTFVLANPGMARALRP